MNVDLDGGNNDVLTVVNSRALAANFDGGDGSGDTLIRSHNNFGTQTDLNFEHIIG